MSVRRGDLGGCLEGLERVAEAAERLGLDAGAATETLAEARARLGFPGTAFVCALAGGTGAGKSSLLNALAGREVSRPGPTRPADEPLHDPEELLGLAPVDLKVPADVREILARVVDGSRFAEWKPLYGANLVCGWASVHGFPVGVLANAQGVLFSEESNKAAHFVQLANRLDTPLLFLQNTTGYMVGREYEQGGIVKDGAKMINAVANSTVPHVTLLLGASYGAGGYGMAGRAYDPRFLFAWPASRSAVMGPDQLAGVMSILNRASAEAAGRPFDEEADRSMRRAVRDQVEAESTALFNTGLLYDDGIIDPRDTRTVLGIALSACHSGEVKGTDGFGVFRM